MSSTNCKQSFTMWMTPEEHKALKEEADEQGLTMTQILRLWIRAALLKKHITMPAE